MAESPGPRVLMIGPVPRIYGGISAVVGTLLDSELPRRCRLTYLAEGTRQGPVAKLGRFVSALAQTVGRLARRQVDVLHLHVGDGASFYRHALFLALGRLAGVPVLFHWHLPGDAGAATSFYQSGGALRRRLVRWVLRHSQRVVVLSPSWQPALLRIAADGGSARSPSGLETRLVALPNPVDCAAIRSALAEDGVRQKAQVLFLGDFSPRKGARDLIVAAPAVLAEHPGATFAICGGAPPPDVVLLAAGLEEAVRFPGFVRGSEKLRLLQESAMLVLPSYAEGVPIAVLEAMAAGLPVVTTPVGGVPDFLADGRNGLLVPPGDLVGLATAINRLLADDALRSRMGRHNHRQALAEFDVPIYVARLMQVYDSVYRS